MIACALSFGVWYAAIVLAARRAAADAAAPFAFGATHLAVAIAALLFALFDAAPASTADAIVIGVVAALCAVCTVTDLQAGLVYDRVTLPSAAVLLVTASWSHSLTRAFAGAASFGGILLILFLVTRRRGIGFGDVKLACCLGAALGVKAAMHAAEFAFVSGGFVALVLLCVMKRSRRSAMPFAPFLSAASLAALAT